MKLLVTGADGFIGDHVVRIAEERGHDVWSIDRYSGEDLSNYDTDSFKGYDAVIHLAAFIDIGESFKKPMLYIENNLLTIELLAEARRVVFASSAAVYGPYSPYGYTKRLGESLLPRNSVSLRIFNPFGPGENHKPETHIVPILADSILKGKGVTLHHNGNQQRSFIDVRDVAEAFVLAAESNIDGAYDLCNEKLSIREVADIMGADYALEKTPRDEGDTGYLAATGWELQEALGWKPRYNVREQLKNWREWYE